MGDKTKVKGSEGQTEETIDPEKLQKSWNDSVSELRKSVEAEGGDMGGGTKKAKKKIPEFEAEEEEDEGDDSVAEEEDEAGEEEAEEEPKKKVKKSLPDLLAEDDPEAEAAMDIEPFLKSLAKVTGNEIQKLEKSISALTRQVQIHGKALLSQMEMQKSIQDTVQIIGGQPVPARGVLQKSTTGRFPTGEGAKEMNKQEVMLKAMDLQREGKLNVHDVTILEGRMNNGSGIPEEMKPLFASEGGK
jgi:hypothetical protein